MKFQFKRNFPEDTLHEAADIQIHPGSDNVLGVRRKDQFIHSAVVGILVGAIAVIFQLSLNELEKLRFSFLGTLKHHPSWGWVVLPVIGGLFAGMAGYLTQHFAPEASGSGIPHIKA